MRVDIVVFGDREVAFRLERLPDDLNARLEADFVRLTRRLESMVEVRAPQRTGRLRSEIGSQVEVKRDSVRGRVFVAAAGVEHGKAAALEYGAHRRHTVREHTRTIRQVFGRVISPMQLVVRRYQRTPNIPEHRFLRGPAQMLRDDVAATVRQAISEVADR